MLEAGRLAHGASMRLLLCVAPSRRAAPNDMHAASVVRRPTEVPDVERQAVRWRGQEGANMATHVPASHGGWDGVTARPQLVTANGEVDPPQCRGRRSATEPQLRRTRRHQDSLTGC